MNRGTYKNLAVKPVAAGALFFNDKNELLIVKPHYRDDWLIPGGMSNENESPYATCLREVKEELGLELPIGPFLGVDYKTPDYERGEGFQFVFYGGILSDAQIQSIKLQADELSEYRFVTISQALELLALRLKRKIPEFIEAYSKRQAVYLEDGKQVILD